MIALAVLPTACIAPVPLPTGEPAIITFACLDHERSQYEALVKEFEKATPSVRVRLVSADELTGTRREGNTLISSGDEFERLAAAADTFVWFTRLQPADWPYLLDLQPFVDEEPSFPTDDFYPGTLDGFRWQGHLRGLPAEVLPVLIFYDKKMFDEAGIAYPQIGWTWDDFLEVAVRLTAREGEQVNRYGFVDGHFRSTVFAMLDQYGVPLWEGAVSPSVAPPQPLFDRPAVADVLRRYVDMALTYGVMPLPEVGSNLMAFNLINERKAAMWTSFAFDYDYQAQRAHVGLVPFPEDVAAANPTSMYGFFASGSTAYPDAAWRWLNYLSEHYRPALEYTLPGRRTVGERLPWWRRLDEETRSVFEYALAHPSSPDDPRNLPLSRALAQVLQDQASVEEALAAAQAQALETQAELAAAAPVAPQPVPPPQPTPAEVQATVTFAPAMDSDASLYRQLATRFQEAHPDVRVEVVSAPWLLPERAAASDCFGGTFSARYPEARQYIRGLEPLLETDSDLDVDDFYPSFVEPLQHDGALWGIPYEADALMVYYNREHLAQAGLPLPGFVWSMDDFLDAAAALSGDDRYGFTTREGAYGDLLFVLERLGARLLDTSREPHSPTFDDPAVVAALARYAGVSRQHPLSPQTPSSRSGWPDQVMWGGHPTGVETGQVSVWIDYLGNQAVAPRLPFEVGVAALPTPAGAGGQAGTQGSTEFSVSAYYISAHAPDPQACWEWLTFLSSQPEVVRLLPARRSVAASSDWQGQVDEAALAAYQATLEYGDAPIFRLGWESPWLAYAYPWLDEAFQATVAGQDAGRALSEAQRKAEAYVQCLERQAGLADPQVLRACATEVDPGYQLPGESPPGP